jgi:hypothetical protein
LQLRLAAFLTSEQKRFLNHVCPLHTNSLCPEIRSGQRLPLIMPLMINHSSSRHFSSIYHSRITRVPMSRFLFPYWRDSLFCYRLFRVLAGRSVERLCDSSHYSGVSHTLWGISS